MIKNEKQYKVTKNQLNLLTKSIENIDKHLHPLLVNAQVDAIQSQYETMKKELLSYEELKAGKFNQLELESFDLLPQGLIKARIARGLSQKELAEKLGLAEQQVQKYEATEYASASFERLKQVINALNLKVREEIFLSNTSFTETNFFKNLLKIGISKDFILQKILSNQLSVKLQNIKNLSEIEAENVLNKVASTLSKIFLFDLKDFSLENLSLDITKVHAVRYKKSTSANPIKVTAYTIYAHLLALSLYQSSKNKTQLIVNEDPLVVRNEIITKYGKLNFENVIKYSWNLGIPVLALNDIGAFHGACWRIEGFNIIVIKQKTMSEARWTFDLLHELCHAGQHIEQRTLDIIETDDLFSTDIEDEDEKEANFYAHDVLLGENADDMAEECIIAARGNMTNLKKEVQRIALKNKIDVGAFSNFIAFRLSTEQNHNWWGTANNLQTLDFSPWEICRKHIIRNCDLDVLSDFDRELLVKALI